MNGTMKKRIVAGLLALGMIFSPTGAGITTIPSFAESGVSVNAEDDAAGGDETAEDGEASSDEGETDSDEGETDSEDGKTASDEGDADSNNGETDPDEGENKNEEASAEETAGAESKLDPRNVEVIGADPILEQSGSGVLPYKLYVFNDVIELSGELSAKSLPVNAGYEPTVYASTEGYDGLNAKQKKVYAQLYARALEIDASEEDYGEKYYFDGSDEPVYLFGKNTSGSDLPAAEDLVGYVFCDAGTSSDDIYKAYTALGYDNPQLFWYGHSLTGYNFRTSSGKITCAVVLSTEVEDYANGAKRQAAKTELYNKIDEIVMGAAAYANGYSVEWYIHDYLCKNTIYDPNYDKSNKSPYNHDVTGLLLHNICVCESYAKCTQLLINAITNAYDLGDLDVRYVVGMAYGYNGSKYVLGGGHAWNQILLDGQWYNFDATWDDVAPEEQAKKGEYTYDYFNVTDNPFTKEHHAFEYYEKMYSTSKCTATDYSYDNHEYNYAKEEDIRFTVSVNGKTVFKAASVEGALHYINRTKNTKNDYVINCISEENLVIDFITPVTLGNANSIKFTGNCNYNFGAGLTINCDVIFDSHAVLRGKVTSSAKTVTITNGFLEIAEAAEVDLKTLVLDSSNSEYPVEMVDHGAEILTVANLVSTAKNSNAIHITSIAVFGNITTTGDFDLRISVDADVSVTGKVVYNTAKLNLIPMKVNVSGEDVSYNNVEVENGTTLLEATTAAATCFKSSYVFTATDSGLSEDVNYAVYKEGKEVKLTLPRVYVYENGLYGSFATFDEAVAAINADKLLNGKNIVIELADNVVTEKMAMPSKVNSVYLRSAGLNNYKIDVTANTVSFPTKIYIDNVRISTKDTKGLTISAAKDIYITGLTSDNLAAIKGTAKGNITFDKTFGNCSVTGFNEMMIYEDFECGTINVGTLVIQGCNLNVKQANASVTVKNIKGTGNAAIVYAKGAKPVAVTAGAEGSIMVTTVDTGFTDGQKLVTAKTADMSVFKLDQDKVPNDCTNGYTLSRNGSDLCAAKVTMKVRTSKDANSLKFAKWTDVVSTIEARNDKAEYAVNLLDNVNVNGALKMPKAGTYSWLYFNGNDKKLVFTGNITLTGDTVFDSVDLVSVKKTKNGNEGVAYSIAAGKYYLGLSNNGYEPTTLKGLVDANADNAGLANITSSDTVSLGNATINGSITANNINIDIFEALEEEISENAVEACNSFTGSELEKTSVIVGGNLTAKSVLYISGSLTVKGAFSAAGIQADSDAKLYLYQGKKPADIGKTGFIGSETVEFALLGADGKTVEIKNVQVIANIKGKYADHLVPVSENIDTEEQEVGYYIVKSGTQLIAKPKNTEFMKVKVNGKTAYYPDYDSIIKDITTVADPKAEYIIYFGEEVKLDKLTLPGAKKYGKITFAAEGSTATIKTLGDLTLTGNFVLDSEVTINKYDKDYKDIVDINVNAGAYRFECKGKLSYKDDANHLGKLAGAKNSSIDLYNSETWEVSTAVAANDLGLDGGALVLGDKAPLTLTGEISEAIVKYPFANASKIKFGKIRGIDLVSTDSTTLKDGTYLANVTGEVLGGIGAEGFDAIRSGNKLIAGDMNKAMLVMNEKEHAGCYYDTFENAIAGITAANNPDVDYTLYLWEDVTVKKLTLPAAKKYKSLTLASRFGNAGTITTESDIVLTGDLTNGVGINKVKSGKIVPISINTGTYTFNCGVLSNDEGTTSYIANITGKGKVAFGDYPYANDVNISGNVNVGTFVVSSTVTLGEKSGFTCTNLVPDNGKLVYTEKNASKVKLGNVEYNRNSITFPMLGEGKLLANITGDLALNSIEFGMDDETNLDDIYRVARKGNKLFIVKIADAVIMTDQEGKNRSYCSPEDALTDIARINDPDGEYTICLTKDWTPKKLALPAKGKYASIKFVFDDVKGAAITVSSDITLTGDLIIGANVTLKKASGTLKITAPKNSGFTASTEGTGKIIGTGAIE